MNSPSPNLNRSSLSNSLMWLCVAALILVGCLRIASTWFIFSEVFDESPHIAAGMEPLQRGTYSYERKHTPLGRMAFALPLYLRGIRGQNLPDMNDEGHLILYSGDYFTNLAWARSGNLVFFLLCCILLALAARRWFGSWEAIAAVGLFTFLPPVLGNAALATTDMAATCGLMACYYAFSLWLEKPDALRTMGVGAALGFALIGKVSVLPFFAIGAVAILGWAYLTKKPLGIWVPLPWKQHLRNFALATLVLLVTLWAPYHFRFATISTGHGYRPEVSGTVGTIVNTLLDTKVPLGEFLGGIGSAATFNKLGYPAYFMGMVRATGWWYFFPLVFAIKTPIAFLILTLMGALTSVWWFLRSDYWQRGIPLVFAVATFLVCVFSALNLGVRHLLPIYPLLALVAAGALQYLFTQGKRWLKVLAVALLTGLAAESAMAHPDYLAYFNPLAGQHPERIVVSSDLDWGQDLQRLVLRLKELRVNHVNILFSGASALNKFDLPPFVEFKPADHPTGWVAVSATRMMIDCIKDGNYCEWKDRQPVERVGKSIFLFYVPENTAR